MADFIRHVVFVLLLPISLLILAPCLYILAGTLKLVRFFARMAKIAARPEYGNFLIGMDGMFAADDPYHRPQTVNSFAYLVDGEVTLTAARERMADAVDKYVSGGYLNIRDYVSTWMGYAVWKPERSFRIEDHVRLITTDKLNKYTKESQVTDENVGHILHQLSSIPFSKGLSPWELCICYDVKSKRTVSEKATMLFLRMHHVIGDGTTVMNLITNFFQCSKSTLSGARNLIRSEDKFRSMDPFVVWKKIIAILQFVRVCVYRCDSNIWHQPWTASRRKYAYGSLTLPKDQVKRVRKFRGVSFTTVLCAAQTGAIKRCFADAGQEVPEAIHAVVSVPFDVFVAWIQNNISSIVLKYPTGESDRNKVCKMIEDDLQLQRDQDYPFLIEQLASFVSLLPQKLKFLYPGWCLTTCGGTNYPGFLEPISFNGMKVVWHAEVSQLPSNIGMYFWAMGYGSDLTITFGFSRDIVDGQGSVDKFIRFFKDELDALDC